MSRPPHYAYYVLADQVSIEQVHELLHGLRLDEAWVRVIETTARYEEHPLLQVELYDLDEGLPIYADEIGPTLSAESRVAFSVGFHEEDGEAALGLFASGEVAFMWAGQLTDFEAEEEEGGAKHLGEAGFRAVFTDLIGHPLEDFLDAATVDPEVAEVADEHTDLLLRGRFMGLPAGLPREIQLFRFHQADEDEDEDDDDDDDDDGLVADDNGDVIGVLPDDDDDDDDEEAEDHVALVLFDLRLAEHLWKEAPAQEVGQFLEAIEPLKAKVLGPVTEALEGARQWVATQPPERPLALSRQPDLATFEVLAMASALAYYAGTPVERFDEQFLPLLAMTQGNPPSAEAVRDSLDEIEELGVLSAMAEVLPYSVPEGALLECFDDDEVKPLAAWAAEGDEYEGSIFLVDLERLISNLAAFDVEQLRARAEAFLRVWFEVAPGGFDAFDSWRAEREIDEFEWDVFQAELDELRHVLSLLGRNSLQPALVFYGA